MSALPFGPETVGEDRFWDLQEALLDEEDRAGLTCVTGGPGLFFRVWQVDGTSPSVVFDGERALRYLEIAKRRSVGRAAVAYGGFFRRPPHTCSEPGSGDDDCFDAAIFARGFAAFGASMGCHRFSFQPMTSQAPRKRPRGPSPPFAH